MDESSLFGEGAAHVTQVSVEEAPKSKDHDKFVESEEKSVIAADTADAADASSSSSSASRGGSVAMAEKPRTMNEVILSAEREDATTITAAMGFITKETGPVIKGREAEARDKEDDGIGVFNMSNNSSIAKMTKEQKEKMRELISFSIIDTPGIKIVKMNNASIDDAMVIAILELCVINCKHLFFVCF